MTLCDTVVQRYLQWLADRFHAEGQGHECTLVTPYEDPWGDLIEVTIRRLPGSGYIVSDGGETIDNLFQAGVDPLTGLSRKRLFETFLNDNAVVFEEGEIRAIAASDADLPRSLHRLITAAMSIQHLVYTAKPYAAATFREDVAKFLTEHGVSHTTGETLQGKARPHSFDIVVPERQGRIVGIRTLSTTRPSYANHLAVYSAFAYQDVKALGTPLFAVSVLDDRAPGIWTGEPLNILAVYSDATVYWSKRQDLLGLVA